jgi:hypothetical protein
MAPHLLTACTLLLAFLGPVAGSPARAEVPRAEEMPSLDEQVQDIKSDVLSIAVELGRLEERLLYPSDTQVAVFVSLSDDAPGDSGWVDPDEAEPDEEKPLRLDSVRIRIDGELAAHHIYRFEELEALQKGGVQRIYTGNVQTGDHRIEVSVDGKHSGGAAFRETRSFDFRKEVEPKLLGITVRPAGSDSAEIAIRDW